jgi:hypothetical protein
VILADDEFPSLAPILPSSEDRLKNVNLFNDLWEKVCWGDLKKTDAKKYKGRYYILSQQDGYFNVPQAAIMSEQEQNWTTAMWTPLIDEPTRLHIWYIRYRAMAKFEWWAYIKNKDL